jgi:diguanylate cyclase
LRPNHGTARLLRDPVLRGLIGAGLLGALFFLSGLGSNALKVRGLWCIQVPYDVALVVVAGRAARVPGLPKAPRRFLTVFTFTALMFTTGDAIQTVDTLAHPSPAKINGGYLQTAFFLFGAGATMIAMLRYPTWTNTRAEKLRFWLDAATVLVGGAALAWYFTIDPADGRHGDWVNTVATASMVLVAAFAAVKVLLSPQPPMTRSAASPMVAAALVQGVGIFAAPANPEDMLRPELLALRLLPTILITLGPRIQELQSRDNPVSFSTRRRRPYNAMPYLAVAITFFMLLAVLPDSLDIRIWGVVAGVVLITAIVVVRQLVTFHDNFELINQLDSALLELRGHQQLLHEQATHDGLTRLANRTAFTEAVEQALAEKEAAPELAVLLIDLDDFKTVNDTLGHGVGDALLVNVADRLRAAVRAPDLVARLGGDEFAILLHAVTATGAGALAERLLGDIAQPVHIDDHTLVVRASIGVAPAGPADGLEGLLRNADIAMYEAKDGGKGTFEQYTPDMGARILRTAELGARLRDAIGTDEFHIEYQPIIDLETGDVFGVESLIRWHPPDHAPIAPPEFIPTAERTGLIVPLGRWILREVCRQAGEWRAKYPAAEPLRVGVNVAGRQLDEPGFADEVAAALAEFNLPADRLVIEVTETAVLDMAGTLPETLHALRRMGVGLALDDFGTAASSLGLLLTCPVSSLKLDRSFVEQLGTDSRQAAVATAVVQIARALNLSAVAEGVETAEQARLLRELGYRKAQGYHFSRPLRAQDFARHWERVGV